jgi:hypothetical protein
VKIERFPDVLFMEFHRFLAYGQETGDLFVGSPLSQQLNNFPLSRGHFHRELSRPSLALKPIHSSQSGCQVRLATQYMVNRLLQLLSSRMFQHEPDWTEFNSCSCKIWVIMHRQEDEPDVGSLFCDSPSSI